MINEAFAKKFFPGEDPIGQKVQMYGRRRASDPSRPIVGVVADIKQARHRQARRHRGVHPVGAVPDAAQETPAVASVAVRRRAHRRAIRASSRRRVHRAVADLDPTLPISQLRTMDDVMWEAVARPRFLTFLLDVLRRRSRCCSPPSASTA